MKKVSRSPLGAARRAASPSGLMSALRAPAALALAFALLASLAPLGAAARAETPKAQEQVPVAEDGPVYVIEQTPDGDVSCRVATPSEIGPVGDGTQTQPALHQLNHLPGKESATQSVSAGLTIILRGTARLELPENAQAKAAFIAAAAKWEELISSQITVTIDVDYGPDFFGQPYSSSSTLGATSSGGFIPPYSTIRQNLIARAPAGSDEAALLNNLPASSLPTDIGDVSTIFVTTAVARALGLNFNESTAPVPRIGFNSNFTFDFDHTNGVSGTDFDSVAVHEIGHALGFTSRVGARELDPSSQLLATVWDIYRFRPGAGTAGTFSSAPRVLSSGTSFNDPHVAFTGAGELQLSTGKPDGTGGDEEQASHWKDDSLGVSFIGIMDPTLPRGRHEEITPNDLRAIDFFGYSVGAIPEPPNNHFANAEALSGSSGRVQGTNRGSNKEAGEPSHSDDNNVGGKSVWYRWTAPASGPVNFNTGPGEGGGPASNFDTVLAVYTGSSVGALTPIIKNDDVNPGVVRTSTVTFNAVAGTTYRIAVDGWKSSSGFVPDGTIWLNWGQSNVAPTTVQFSTSAFSVSEGAATATVNVTRAGGTNVAFSLGYSVLPGTADTGDYTSGSSGGLDFSAGETSKNITISIRNDPGDEPNETLNLSLLNPTAGVTLGTPSTAVLTIIDDDPPVVSGNSVDVTEGNAGTINAVVTFTLSSASSLPVSVNYQTGDGTATAGPDYLATAGKLNFAPGETSKTVTVAVFGDTEIEFGEFFRVDLFSPVNATVGNLGRVAIIGDDAGTPPPSTPASGGEIHFTNIAYSAFETQGTVPVGVTRGGNTSQTVTVELRTIDNPAAVPCSDISTPTAFARCDYATTVETITFGPGETFKSVNVPIIDDSYGERDELIELMLSNPTGGARLGSHTLPIVNLLIFSNEQTQDGPANPIGGVPFFVRQHYLDFLSREPEAGEPWSNVLNTCPDQFNSPSCDRLTVSEAFFGSPEFNLKAGFAFRFYKVAFGRLPEYSEIVVDMRQLTGATGPEVIARRAAFSAAYVQRTDFATAFMGMSDEQFVNTLMGRYNLQLINSRNPSTPEDDGSKIGLSRTGLTTALNNGQWTRAQVLRAIADSDEVKAAEFRPSFVAIQYYGYLRRTPEPSGYQAWLNYLNANPNDSRTMVNGFLNSAEYRLRFGRN